MWLFGIADAPYTLHAANIVQIAHIFLGALGLYLFVRGRSVGRSASLFAAIAYLSMGGFYDGSQHVDIVRGYAFLPWCLLALKVSGEFSAARTFVRVIPFSLYFLSAYPGQIVAAVFIFPVYVLLQIYSTPSPERPTAIKNTVLLGAVVLIAAGTAVPKYLPFALDFTNEISRSGRLARINRATFDFVHIFSFALDTSKGSWPRDVTIRSYYVGIVVLSLLLFSAQRVVKNQRDIVVMAIVSLILAANIPLLLFGEYASFFGLSRFNLTDYKGFITLSVITLAAASLDSIRNGHAVTLRRAIVVSSVLTIYICAGVWLTDSPIRYDFVVTFLSLYAAAILVYLLSRTGANLAYSPKMGALSPRNPSIVYTLLFVVLVVNAVAVHRISPLWRDKGVLVVAPKRFAFDPNTPPAHSSVIDSHDKRPERIDIGHIRHYSSRGFYTGEFIIKGYDASKNLRTHEFLGPRKNYSVDKSDPLVRFYMMPSCAIVFDTATQPDEVLAYLDDTPASDIQSKCDNSSVLPVLYKSNEVDYSVNLEQDSLIVENEITWKGWSASISDTHNLSGITPLADFSPLRAWLLPKGVYSLSMTFENTYRRVSFIAAAVLIMTGAAFSFGFLAYTRLRKS